MEDLRLGRGRNVRSMQQIDAAGTAKIPPDFTRVCVAIFGIGNPSTVDSITVYIGDAANGPSFFVVPLVGMVTILKIEELGQFITQGMVFVINNNSGAAIAQVVDIYTEVNAPPLDNYKP